MEQTLTLNGITWPRISSFLSGMGMVVASALTIDHYFSANFPETIWEGSFCDINAFFNCDSSAYSMISQVRGVPLGYFGLVVGILVALGALFPSPSFERSNKNIALVNFAGVAGLFLYSVFVIGSLCLLCTGYYVFSILSFLLFWKFGIDGDGRGLAQKWIRPSVLHLGSYAVFTALGAYGFMEFHAAKEKAQSGGVQADIVEQYFSLPAAPLPSFLSPYWSIRSTERFEDAPVQIVEYGDLLCPDCKLLADQMAQLAQEFPGKINLAYQLFPLEAACNDVVEKDLHPGACDITYMAAHDPAKFQPIHDEIWASWPEPRRPEWRQELGRRHGVEDAVSDPQTRAVVHRIIQTGKEYPPTSSRYSHGIRSTPTMILNGRMVIGTLPYDQLRAIVSTLIRRSQEGGFIENWVQR